MEPAATSNNLGPIIRATIFAKTRLTSLGLRQRPSRPTKVQPRAISQTGLIAGPFSVAANVVVRQKRLPRPRRVIVVVLRLHISSAVGLTPAAHTLTASRRRPQTLSGARPKLLVP